MNILLIHQNFPGQFLHLAPALVRAGHKVTAFALQANPPAEWNGVKIIGYLPSRSSTANIHPWVIDFETKIIRAEAAFICASNLKAQGYTPDLIIAHHGWGESLFLKDVWPTAKLAIYCEFFYHAKGADMGFDPEFPVTDPADICRLNLKNTNNNLHFNLADAGISPTKWQASTFPDHFRNKITVIHDGINTQTLTPNPNASITLNNTLKLTRKSEVITFVNRNLEPMRGYHTFMRALPALLKSRPKAQILLVGGDGVSYGKAPEIGAYKTPQGQNLTSWKQIFIHEVSSQISQADWKRVHFLGHIPYNHFVTLLQVSKVHVYLTYPFVLSWSLLEAMSCGCAIVASNTKPLHEAIEPGKTGRLIDFFAPQELVENVGDLLEHPKEAARLGKNAREFAKAHYDLNNICLPNQLAWVESLLA